MANTFELINSYTAPSSQSSVTFSSIPSTYKDIVIVGSTRSTTNDLALLYRLNGSSSGYTAKYLGGTGSAAESSNFTTLTAGAGGTWGRVGNAGNTISSNTANTFSNWQMYIPNYAGSTNKSASFESVTETNATEAFAEMQALLWSNTDAINSVAFAINSAGSFVTNSTFYLYGVKSS